MSMFSVCTRLSGGGSGIKRQLIKATIGSTSPVARSISSKCLNTLSRGSFDASFTTPSTTMRGWARGYASYPPHTILRMPALSPTMTSGNVGEWKKKVGEEIVPGDVLVEIETDKAQMDFECQDEGFLAKIIVPSGEKEVAVNKIIGILAENKADVDKFADYKEESAASAPAEAAAAPAATPTAATPAAPETPSSSAPVSALGRIMASPLAKSVAESKSIDLKNVKGSGPEGRILKADVEEYKAPAPVAAVAKPAPVVPAPAPAAGAAVPAFTDTPLSNMRKVIAERLTQSTQSIPHFYLTVEINADKILKLREVLNGQAGGKFKLSVNDFIIKASALALKDVPDVNSSWQGNFIREFSSADIAVAVATDNGLITPIVRGAEGKGLGVISSTVKSLADKARSGKLAPHEYQGGTFTISNLGMYGIQHFTAIINPPHACILAIGGVSEKLVVDSESEKGFSVQKVMNVTLSADHRVVDGAVGAQWLQRFKGYVENPLTMLL